MKYPVTPSLLRVLGATRANAELFAPLIEKHRVVPGDDYNTITSRSGISMVCAMGTVESGGFNVAVENLNYTVEALQTGNKRKYITSEQAALYGAIKRPGGGYVRRADQRMIGNLYYGTRMGNRPGTDDGYDNRGRGLIQRTGRNNYMALAKYLGMTIEQARDYCETPEGSVVSLFHYWRTEGLVGPASRGDVATCTDIVTGGDHGLQARITAYKTAWNFYA